MKGRGASEAKGLGYANRSRGFWRRHMWGCIGAAASALLGLVVVLVSAGPDSTVADGSAAKFDFPIALYQGEEVIGAGEFSFASLLGDKPIVLNYRASNCAPCSALPSA